MQSLWSLKRFSILAALAVILMVGHGVFLYDVYSRLGLAIVLGSILLVVVKHVGAVGTAYGYFRRRDRGIRYDAANPKVHAHRACHR